MWDENENGVVGMIVEVATKEGVHAAFAIPTEKLIEAWPALDEYVNNNFALIAEEFQHYLEHLCEQLAFLQGIILRFQLDFIRQRIRMNQQYDPSYEETDGDTVLAQSNKEEQEGSAPKSEQVYKTAAGGAQQSDVVSWDTFVLRALK